MLHPNMHVTVAMAGRKPGQRWDEIAQVCVTTQLPSSVHFCIIQSSMHIYIYNACSFFFSLLADSAHIISATRPGGAWKSSLECLNDVDEREAARLRMVEAAMRMGENRLEVTRSYVEKTELYVPNRSFSSAFSALFHQVR